MTIGQNAPTFSLLDQNSIPHTLTDYRGQWVLLYFYPKDDTPGCTKEACGFRDSFSQFKKNNAVVLGVSPDSVKSHDKFQAKYDLPFPLLSDSEKTVVNLYQVWAPKKFMGREFIGTLRSSFLIVPTGKIAKIYEKVKPDGHATEVLSDIKILTY
ncbi:MAG: thioredoxin-dependent thiol peroxidase [Patescibacteria group bacterium]